MHPASQIVFLWKSLTLRPGSWYRPFWMNSITFSCNFSILSNVYANSMHRIMRHNTSIWRALTYQMLAIHPQFESINALCNVPYHSMNKNDIFTWLNTPTSPPQPFSNAISAMAFYSCALCSPFIEKLAVFPFPSREIHAAFRIPICYASSEISAKI